MTPEFTREQLKGLLVDLREDLDREVKNWLDLKGSNDDKAKFAKAVLAIANHGGGFIVLGFEEKDGVLFEAKDHPDTLDGYSQDLINGIVENYADPSFHCAVSIVPGPSGTHFPIVIVPGSHRVPIRARRGGPNGNIVENNAIYIRKPGPKSETPQNAQEWDNLLSRCFWNRRDEFLGHMRNLLTGAAPKAEQAAEPSRLEKWNQASFKRWHQLVEPLPESAGPRFQHGWYCISYEIIGDRRQIEPADIRKILQQSEVHYTGWPPFWYPTSEGIKPYPIDDGVVQCWLGSGSQTLTEQPDVGLSDFWRIHPDGLAFLLRGFQEDGLDAQRPGREPVPPATAFDITLPVWAVGEAVLHAGSLAGKLFDGPSTVRFTASYEGLAGRSLTSLNRIRFFPWHMVAHQNSITLETHIDTQDIDPNLPEIVHPLLSPLYALFDFFNLPMELVAEELTRMKSKNF